MVTINIQKCDNAHECRLCVKACPFGLIQLCPLDIGGYEATLTSRIAAHFTQLCNACERCARACPEEKISVSISETTDWSKANEIIAQDEAFQKYLAKREKQY